MVKISIKWGKFKYDDIEVNESEPVEVLRAQLYALTRVPADKQKIMVKGGFLKDDADLSKLGLKEGQQLMMMGTAEGGELKAPEERVVFEEDLSSAEKAKILQQKTGEAPPAGLANLGNTCYMNSTLQCLRAVKELREALQIYPGNVSQMDLSHNIAAATRELFQNLETSGEAVHPFLFLQVLRNAYPQFAQQGARGAFMQQDAEECWNAVLSALGGKLKDSNQSNLIDHLFGIEMETKYVNTEGEDDTPEVMTEVQKKLPCHIDNQNQPINHLHEGVKLSLEETVEKWSPSLNRNAIYKKQSRMARLPPYVMVQFVRFFWKKASASAGTEAGKAKILRNVSFPAVLDVYEFCSDALKEQLAPGREIDRRRRSKESGEAKANAAAEAATEAGTTESSSSEAKPEETPMDIDLPTGPCDNGTYELVGVVTHKGRAADSGHYVGWVKKNNETWLMYDDDDVCTVPVEEIMKLRGGGDWHMAYLCLYRKIQVQL